MKLQVLLSSVVFQDMMEGLRQQFHIELYSSLGLIESAVEKEFPVFEIDYLPSGTSLLLWFLQLMILEGATLPVLGALIAIVGALVSIAVIIILCSKHWSSTLEIPETPTAWEPGHQYI
ncbi:uncharacterized protein CEXT_123291 [Caerostris extrusa]|uniref:Uncharacterized protein n=1 Tax=Caerostris extrusa TaxID=172846 RepID=A0AAV4X8E4_CAEEX|nr:uncharacterized protein CEXT_123291 [Caerostris extrusa]